MADDKIATFGSSGSSRQIAHPYGNPNAGAVNGVNPHAFGPKQSPLGEGIGGTSHILNAAARNIARAQTPSPFRPEGMSGSSPSAAGVASGVGRSPSPKPAGQQGSGPGKLSEFSQAYQNERQRRAEIVRTAESGSGTATLGAPSAAGSVAPPSVTYETDAPGPAEAGVRQGGLLGSVMNTATKSVNLATQANNTNLTRLAARSLAARGL